MTVAYTEIETLQELRQLNRRLAARFMRDFRYQEWRMIGSPGGNFKANVRFLEQDGDDVFWWSTRRHKKKRLGKNLFGHGEPRQNINLNMDIQFNVPSGVFSRNSGGAFLRDNATNRIVLAHRGIATIGHGRIPKATLFAQMSSRLREADTSKGLREFLVIGDLESPSLVHDMARFASQIRAVAQNVGTKRGTGGSVRKVRVFSNKRFAGLGKYFAEFSGQRKMPARKATIADCYHGDVITALKDAFEVAHCSKNREIDLVIALKHRKVFLFEAKTASDTQSIYTAVGQLAVHAPRVAKHFSKMKLEKVIVLPEAPPTHVLKILTHELGIHVLTYNRSQDGQIAIDDLEKLVK